MADRAAGLAALICVVIAGAACDARSSAGPETGLGSSPASRSAAIVPTGFERVDVTLSSRGSAEVDLSLWFAGSPDQWHRGLTGVTDMGGADGMLFQFTAPGSYQFYMWQTIIPLDIFFFDDAGHYVGAAEMEPCLEGDSDRCARYSPDVPFLTAIEVPAGTMDTHGVGAGWSIDYRAPTAQSTTASA